MRLIQKTFYDIQRDTENGITIANIYRVLRTGNSMIVDVTWEETRVHITWLVLDSGEN